MTLLEKINQPGDVRKLTRYELEGLASEIRSEIIRVVHENGGHLASNLGVVELTIALHYTFNFTEDRLLFDVSHQCYTHKLLTGRRERFDTIRKKDGLSGFQNRFESETDPFTIGHAGSVLSAALGMARADEMSGKKRRVVTVIGDAAMGAGNTFEALNHAGALGTKMLVILNDNKMAIAETVGALSNYLTKVRLAPTYTDLKKEIYAFLRNFPVFGRTMKRGMDHLLEILRRSMIHGLMFEDLGFRYYGPIDGHDIDGLLRSFDETSKIDGPVLLHVVTEKGRGYAPACENPEKFHGAKGYLSDNGVKPRSAPEQKTPAYTEVFGRKLASLGAEDDGVVAITAAMPEGTGVCNFKREFPERYVDAGICEQHAVGFASGFATAGFKPVVAIYSTFLQRGFDQIVEMLSLQKLPALIAIDRGGLVGNDGPTHHGMLDVAYMRQVPGALVMAPRDGAELEAMMKFALESGKLCSVRYPRGSVPPADVFDAPGKIEAGRAEVLREGEGVCFVALGSMVYEAARAADILKKDGREVGVVNARFAKPVDADLLGELAGRYEILVTLEEGTVRGGFGAAVLEALSENGGDADKVRTFALPDDFVEHGSRSELLELCGLSAERIAARTVKIIESSSIGTKK